MKSRKQFTNATDMHPELIRNSMTELFVKIVGDFKALTIFSKRCILAILLGSEYTSALLLS